MQKLNYNRVITHTPGTGHVCISDYFKHLWQKLTGMTNANKKWAYSLAQVTRWLNYFCNIWPFRTMKTCPKV